MRIKRVLKEFSEGGKMLLTATSDVRLRVYCFQCEVLFQAFLSLTFETISTKTY